MPSHFILSQAKLLYETKDSLLVLQNLRDKYALSSFPSQMTRVKEEWFRYEDRHERFEKMYHHRLNALVADRVSSKFIDQFKDFKMDGIKVQLEKAKKAAKGELTGSRRTDAAIAKMRILPEYMKDYKLTATDLQNNTKLTTKFLEKRAMNCIKIEDGDELVSRCRKIIAELTENVFIIAAALAVLCGRRSIEILKVGQFKISGGNRDSYSCRFAGCAKKRGFQDKFKVIPLLIKFKYVHRALDHVRDRICVEDMTNSDINAKFSHKLGDSAKILTNSLETRFHDLRAIYGCLTHSMFQNNCSINIWLKLVLMHDNIDTSVFYSRCKVENCTKTIGKWHVNG